MIYKYATPHSSSPVTLPKGLTPHQFYEAIDRAIGINSIYGLIRSGRLKSVQIGNRYIIPATEVNDFFSREAGSS